MVLTGRKAGTETRHHLVERRSRLRHHPAERPPGALGRALEVGRRPPRDPHVEAGREDAFVPTLERIAEPFDILVCDLPFDRGDAAAAGVEQPRGLELDQAVRQAAHGLPGIERLQVEAEVERLVRVDQSAQPVRADVARVVAERQYP